jgi:hypothetical protein
MVTSASRGKFYQINDAIIENLLSWHHSGFHVYIAGRIMPDDETGLEKLAKYIIRACFSQERMVYIPVEKSTDGVAKVIYTSKDGLSRKTFDALDWLAQLVMHIPDRYEQTVRYYGFFTRINCGVFAKNAIRTMRYQPLYPAKCHRRNSDGIGHG